MSDRPSVRIPIRGVIAAVLLAIPFAGTLWVGSYAKSGPRLWSIPFFYWYQFLWVIIAVACTAVAYVLVMQLDRERRAARAARRDAGQGGSEPEGDAE